MNGIECLGERVADKKFLVVQDARPRCRTCRDRLVHNEPRVWRFRNSYSNSNGAGGCGGSDLRHRDRRIALCGVAAEGSGRRARRSSWEAERNTRDRSHRRFFQRSARYATSGFWAAICSGSMRCSDHSCWQVAQRNITIGTPVGAITPTAAATPELQRGHGGVS